MHHRQPTSAKARIAAVYVAGLGLVLAACASPAPDSVSSTDTANAPESVLPTETVEASPATSANDVAVEPESSAFDTTEAAVVLDAVLGTFSTSDFAPVVELLGADGIWTGLSGKQYDTTTVDGFLGSFSSIDNIQRTSDGHPQLDGFGFTVTETSTSGVTFDFAFVVEQTSTGAFNIIELRALT